MRRAGPAALLAGLVVLWLLPACARPTEGRPASSTAPRLTLSPVSGPPGTTVRYQGVGFTPGSPVVVLMIPGLGLVVDEEIATPQGTVAGSFTMPVPDEVAELRYGNVSVFAFDRASGRETPAVLFQLTQR